jgi:hypothetical protein
MGDARQDDFFSGGGDPQMDLFSAEPLQPKAWQPDPDKVRRRLERILAEARAAETMPWDWSQRSLFKKIFPDMASLLPADEAKQYVFQFEQEWERLMAA